MKCDETHDPQLKSWVESAAEPGCDFPIQNLPFGIFKRKDHLEKPRGGVAIGDQILDLAVLDISTGPTLNGIAGMGRAEWKKLRRQISRGLSQEKHRKRWSRYLLPMKQAQLFVPVDVGDYTDFFTGIHHATNMGRMLRPDNPLLPNYKWVPIGYHGRGSSILVSGTDVVRPRGQIRPSDADPIYAPTRRLDYEAELGFVVGPGNRLGKSIPIGKALEHVFGVVLLNDWSARDIQAWEYQPLGPFLAKSFATTISPWIVTLEALAPFRCAAFARAAGDPKPLAYLWDDEDQRAGGFDIQIEMHLKTRDLRSPVRLSRASFRDSYWTVAQLVAHHTSNGCNLRPGDLLGSGTISGATLDSYGSMMELTQGGRHPVELPGGERRAFLEDGDEVVQNGYCENGTHVRIGFGEAAGAIRP
ncbi:MAG TPA: fumarylacetoacetase [Burkholderiales bacterium]|nr:fumarylacetoacetase [Burkholderiales bacterium]